MGTWKVTIPEATTNIFADSQFGLADPDTQWTIAGPNAPPDDVTRSTTYQFFGTGCALFTMAGASLDLTETPTVVNDVYTMSWRIRRAAGGVVTNATAQAHFDTANANWDSITALRDGWYLCVITDTATAGARAFGIHCLETGLLCDGAQLEYKPYPTTYCDGDQLGCYWELGPHSSSSTRSALETRGGVKVDLEDYELYVRDSLGAGMPQVQNILTRYGQQPGAVFQRQSVMPRYFTLVGAVAGTSRTNLHTWRESIIDALKIDRSPTGLPVRLWYDNGTHEVYIDCQYDAGMDLGRTTGTGAERVAVRLVASDPQFYHEGDISLPLGTRDTVTLRYIGARLRNTGQWENLGLTANPTTNGTIYAIKYNPFDGLVYVGGDFTGMDGVAGRDYAAVYNPQDNTWATLGAGSAVSAPVFAIAIAPNGDVYFGGDFLNLGGATGDYLAYWDISHATWLGVAGLGTGRVYALEFGLDNTLYIGGNFVNWAALGADYCVKYPIGGVFTVMDAGNELDTIVRAIRKHPNGDIYIGGSFTTFGANVCNYWCRYDGTDYQIIDTGLSAGVYAIDIADNGDVFLGGAFTNAGDSNGDYIARWTGQQFVSLGTGLNNLPHVIKIGPDGMLYTGGEFTAAGGITVADRTAKWNGYTWAHLDVDLFGAPIVYAIETCRQDLVVKQNYDLYIGFDTTGAAEIASDTTIINTGSRNAYPHTIKITREGGGIGTIIEEIRNETTGRELLFDYGILNGEIVSIHLEPGSRSMESTFAGKRWKILPASDVADFYLMPGTNNITMFIPTSGGGGTQDSYILYRRAEWGVD